LSADDIQYVLKHSANRVGMGLSSLPDSKAGWGRLDGEQALQFINQSEYKIRHNIHKVTQPKPTAVQIVFNQKRVLQNDFGSWPAGQYYMNVWRVSMKISDSVFVAHASVLNCWVRNNVYQDMTQTLFNDNGIDIVTEPGVRFDSLDRTGQFAYVSGDIYYIIEDTNFVFYNKWLTYDTSATSLKSIGAAISYRTDEPHPSSVYVAKDNNAIYHVIFPDPALNTITMKYTIPDAANVSITITDIEGRVLSNNVYNRVLAGDNRVDFDIKGYTPGVYLMRLKINNDQYYDKFIKN